LGLVLGHKKTWAVLVGGYIFSHKIRLRPRLLNNLFPKRLLKKSFICHKVICQDVLFSEMILTEMEIKTPARMTYRGYVL
jgi:hypothetical protein